MTIIGLLRIYWCSLMLRLLGIYLVKYSRWQYCADQQECVFLAQKVNMKNKANREVYSW